MPEQPLLGPSIALKQNLDNTTLHFRDQSVYAGSKPTRKQITGDVGDDTVIITRHLLKHPLFDYLISSFNHVANVSLISNTNQTHTVSDKAKRQTEIPLFGKFGIF